MASIIEATFDEHDWIEVAMVTNSVDAVTKPPLKLCAAPDCDAVLVDLSRNRSGNF